jgi:ribbon-helix-helix protein
MTDLTRWTVKVSKETDVAVRSYLAEHGGKKGDLSKFIERAVRKEVLRATVRDIQGRDAALPGQELQALRVGIRCSLSRRVIAPMLRPSMV